LLAAPRSIEEAELVSTATVDAVLGVLGQIYDIIVIDCGDHLNESSVVAFEKSNHLLYLLDQTVTAVRATQRFLSLYERLALKTQPKLILNRYRSDAPVTIEQIESALHLPVFATVPRDDLAFMESQVRGQNLWKISSGAAVRKSLESLTRKLFSAELAPVAERPSLFGRILASMTHREEKWD
jgi:pilus assembly protein CpaE